MPLLLFLAVCFTPLADTTPIPLSALPEIFRNINSFTHCTISVINLRGLDINMTILHQPITLHRYFIKPSFVGMFPHELRHSNETILKRFHYSGQEFEYTYSLFRDQFRIAHRVSICSADIFLDPPLKSEEPSIYKSFMHNQALLTLYWAYWIDVPSKEILWQKFSFGYSRFYSILVTQSMSGNKCTESVCNAWITSARLSVQYPTHHHELQVWTSWNNSIKINKHCRYCDPCISELFVTDAEAQTLAHIQRGPWHAKHLVSSEIPNFALHEKFYKSKQAITTGLSQTNTLQTERDLENIASTFHTHFTVLVFGGNTTHEFIPKTPRIRSIHQDIIPEGCSKKFL